MRYLRIIKIGLAGSIGIYSKRDNSFNLLEGHDKSRTFIKNENITI
jgi:hypothetical protein